MPRRVVSILQLITIIVWLVAILLCAGGYDIKVVLGIIMMLSGVWVVVAALMGYQNQIKTKTKSNV